MSREWKPGDVGLNDAHGYRSIYVEYCSITEHGRAGGACWHNESGLSDPPNSPRRPLVVIDPEDREAVERLLSAYLEHGWTRTPDDAPIRTTGIDYLQAALREYANPTPPKPDEPQGLGAVVEDEDGTKWVRHDSVPIHRRWLNTDDCDTRFRSWDEIDPVRVLSPGVEVDQ